MHVRLTKIPPLQYTNCLPFFLSIVAFLSWLLLFFPLCLLPGLLISLLVSHSTFVSLSVER